MLLNHVSDTAIDQDTAYAWQIVYHPLSSSFPESYVSVFVVDTF